jgi:CPA2 family monovalent cation:H+ antiporter-2
VRTRYAAEVDDLLKIGADQVIPEEFETSVEIFARVLLQYHVPNNVIANQINMVRFGGYKMLRGMSLEQENMSRIAALFAGATVNNIQIDPGAPCAGRTLAEMDLRKATGATVIAIVRNGEAINNPGPDSASELMTSWDDGSPRTGQSSESADKEGNDFDTEGATGTL